LALDITDPLVFSTVAQTAVLTLTLVVFILSFRTQNNAYKESAYQKLMDDYTDTIRMLVEKPELNKIQIELARIGAPGLNISSKSPEELTTRNYLMLLYGLFERLHLLYRKKWIDKETWNQWSAFLQTIARHPTFQELHHSTEGMFDKPFQDYVSDLLNRKNPHH
jgi:hypothetical protein